jgi:hypothetical protein
MYSMRFDMRAPDFGGSPVELYEAAVDMCEWAETRGCLAAVICEHHSSPDGYLPTPLILGSAVAARTKQLMMTLIVILPFYDPVRLAEEIAVLDLISKGRASYVFGLGYRPEEYAAEVFTVHDLLTGRRSRHAAAILGPPVVLHELVAVAVDPGLAVVPDTPESAKKSPQIQSDNGDPPQQLLAAAHRGMPLRQQKRSERLWIPLHFDRHRMLVQARSVLPGELANQVG